MKHPRSVWISFLVVAAAVLTGCGREEPLRVYDVAHTPRPLTMETPPTWRRVPLSTMDPRDILSKFEAGEGRKKVQISVSVPSNDDPLQNVNRWRGQLRLPPIGKKELDGELKLLKIDQYEGNQYEGKYVEMVAPERPADDGEEAGQEKLPPHMAKSKVREAIYAAMVPAKGRTWFFRLKGPVAVAEREKDTFKAFVENGLRAYALAVREPNSEESADGQ